jgi:hypothetical protein
MCFIQTWIELYLVHLHGCQQDPTTQAPASFKCLAEKNLTLNVNVPQAFRDSYRCSAKQGASQRVQSSAPSHKTNHAKPGSAWQPTDEKSDVQQKREVFYI